MRLRLGHVNIFTGLVIIVTTAYYGPVVSVETAKMSGYLFGAVIALCGFCCAELEEAQDDINELQARVKELEA